MGKLEQFKIDLKALKEDVSDFTFGIDDEFFASVEGREVRSGCLSAGLTISRSREIYDLRFHVKGVVNSTCDLCLDALTLPVDTEQRFVARLGDAYREDEEIIIVPSEEGVIDVSWLIYEMIALSMPLRHVHEEGGCNPQMLSRLREFSTSDEGGDEAKGVTDPRWSELEKLKTIFKD